MPVTENLRKWWLEPKRFHLFLKKKQSQIDVVVPPRLQGQYTRYHCSVISKVPHSSAGLSSTSCMGTGHRKNRRGPLSPLGTTPKPHRTPISQSLPTWSHGAETKPRNVVFKMACTELAVPARKGKERCHTGLRWLSTTGTPSCVNNFVILLHVYNKGRILESQSCHHSPAPSYKEQNKAENKNEKSTINNRMVTKNLTYRISQK